MLVAVQWMLVVSKHWIGLLAYHDLVICQDILYITDVQGATTNRHPASFIVQLFLGLVPLSQDPYQNNYTTY